MRHRPRAKWAAFSILEVLAVAIILAILAALILPNYRGIIAKAQQAVCMANMRSIQVGLAAYLQDNNDVWPQGPTPTEQGAWEAFWLATLKPHDISERTWQCPTIKASLAADGAKPATMPRVHYMPTMFDDTPGVARRWATQPWLIERANAHGQGALISFPDGSIKSFNKVLAEQGISR